MGFSLALNDIIFFVEVFCLREFCVSKSIKKLMSYIHVDTAPIGYDDMSPNQ